MSENAFFELLKEVKAICDENGIKYFLGGKILYFSLFPEAKLPQDFTNMEILLDGKNAKKFINACKSLPKNRILETALRNNKFRNLDMYYINTETTCINFQNLDRREFLGINIPIRIMQPLRKTNNLNVLNKLEKLWRTNFSYHFKYEGATEVYEKANRIFGRLMRSGSRLTSFLFRRLLNTSIKGNESSFKICTRKKRKKYSAKIFYETCKVNIFGEDFRTVKDITKYLTATYGENWTENIFIKEKFYIDENKSDKTYEKELFENQRFWDNLLKKHRIRQINIISNNVYNQNWRMVRSIYEGTLLQDRLLSKKSTIRKQVILEDYSGILETMTDYDKVLKMNSKYHISIDNELRTIYKKAKARCPDFYD